MMDHKKSTAPLTMKCPIGGEEWPMTSFKAMVDCNHNGTILPKHVKMYCPINHWFSLATVSRKRILSTRNIHLMLRRAQQMYEDHEKTR